MDDVNTHKNSRRPRYEDVKIQFMRSKHFFSRWTFFRGYAKAAYVITLQRAVMSRGPHVSTEAAGSARQ